MRPNAISVFLLLLYGMVLLKPFFPYLEYQANREFIAEVLCLNKSRPQMACHGKCHLKKRIQDFSESEKDSPQTPTSEEEASRFLCPDEVSLSKPYLDRNNSEQIPYLNFYQHHRLVSIFHPPIHSSHILLS